MSSSVLKAGLRRLRGLDDSDEQLLYAFTSRRDESAFAALVRRHGPMVQGVCRRVLGHQQDAEDAFQATFLVLARNAMKLRRKTALASFLHGTAHRIALAAKRAAARRRKYEGQAPCARRTIRRANYCGAKCKRCSTRRSRACPTFIGVCLFSAVWRIRAGSRRRGAWD